MQSSICDRVNFRTPDLGHWTRVLSHYLFPYYGILGGRNKLTPNLLSWCVQFVDDVEFWFPPGNRSLVEYRSASRTNGIDFSFNRKRIKVSLKRWICSSWTQRSQTCKSLRVGWLSSMSLSLYTFQNWKHGSNYLEVIESLSVLEVPFVMLRKGELLIQCLSSYDILG